MRLVVSVVYTLLARRSWQASVIHSATQLIASRARPDDVLYAAVFLSSLSGRRQRPSTSSCQIITQRAQLLYVLGHRFSSKSRRIVQGNCKTRRYSITTDSSSIGSSSIVGTFPSDSAGSSPVTSTMLGADTSVSASRQAEAVYHN